MQDYKIHVFNIAHLPRKVRNQFTSDFKVVADYFSEKESPDYQPGNEEIQHVEAVLTLLRVFTNDDRYDSIIRDVKKNKLQKERITMCTFVDRMVDLGVERGIQEGIQQGIQQMIVNMLLDNQSPEQISKYAGCSVEHVYQVKEMMAVKSN